MHLSHSPRSARRRLVIGTAVGVLALAAPVFKLLAQAAAPTTPAPASPWGAPAATATAPAPAAAGAEVLFMRDIAPLLAQRCFTCHDAKAEEPGGDMRIDTYEGMTRGAHPAVLPGQPDKSGIIQRITEEDSSSRMPRDDEALSPEHIDLIRRWIAAGAKFDGPDPKIPYAKKPAAATDTPTVASPHSIHSPATSAELKTETKTESQSKPAESEAKDVKKS